MSMLSARSSVGISAARLRSGAADAVLELEGTAGAVPVLELESPMSSAFVGSEAARFLVGCASRMGPMVSGAACSDKNFGKGDDIGASSSLSPPLIFFPFCSYACAK